MNIAEPFLSAAKLAKLRAIHPTSDLEALLEMPIEDLRYTLLLARDVYHEGNALDGRHGYRHERLGMIAEILELRAHFGRLSKRRRAALQVPPERVPKPSSCVFTLDAG